MTGKNLKENLAGPLREEQGRFLLRLARETITAQFTDKAEKGNEHHDPVDPVLETLRGTFVTLTINGHLRGCIGNLEPVASIHEGIRHNAIHAAFHDSRFSPLCAHELDHVHIDISILTQPHPLAYKDGADLVGILRPGIDGVILGLGRNRATFLPQVWAQLPRAEDFLDQLSLKAGLSPTAWRDCHPEVAIYQVQCFAEER